MELLSRDATVYIFDCLYFFVYREGESCVSYLHRMTYDTQRVLFHWALVIKETSIQLSIKKKPAYCTNAYSWGGAVEERMGPVKKLETM